MNAKLLRQPILFGFATVLFFAGCDVSDSEKERMSADTKTAFENGECQPLTKELFDEFVLKQAHEGTVPEQYLIVTGKVLETNLQSDSSGSEVELVLAPWGDSQVRVSCAFGPSSKEFVMSQQVGDTVKIVGRSDSLFTGAAFSDLDLEGCIPHP
jgi:hypothetical protein|tara:strand:+ start:1275 stop:1739 length:465 start_codon:yes stop_codon:yes gene_type:complete